MGTVLGSVRNWDVFVDDTFRDAGTAGLHAEWIEALSKPAKAKREQAHRAVCGLIDTKPPAEFVVGLQAWLYDPQWAASGPNAASMRIGKIMPDLLDRVARKVAQRGRGAAKLPPPKLHPLRKKLRYASESVTELYGKKRVKRYTKKCKKPQTVLGAINDAHVTKCLLEEIAPAHSVAWAPVAGALQKWNGERLDEAGGDLGNAWRLQQSEPFWR